MTIDFFVFLLEIDGLLKHAFDNIENAASVIPNAFLVFLGLLKVIKLKLL